jgi:hypothetical protein
MTSAALRSVEEGGDGRPDPMPRAERRRRRRERRLVIGTGILVLSALVCVVLLVLGHLQQGRTTPSGGKIHGGPTEVHVHVTDSAA